MKKREIPKKNYVILGIVAVLSVLCVWYLIEWYQAGQQYQAETSPIGEIISEIHSEEVENYILDNGNLAIYVASLQETPNEAFEKNLKKIIVKRDLSDQMVLLDQDKLKHPSFVLDLIQKYGVDEVKDLKITTSYVPNILLFEDGKLVSVYNQQGEVSTYEELDQYMLEHQVGEK